jgi:hypothetical protein
MSSMYVDIMSGGVAGVFGTVLGMWHHFLNLTFSSTIDVCVYALFSRDRVSLRHCKDSYADKSEAVQWFIFKFSCYFSRRRTGEGILSRGCIPTGCSNTPQYDEFHYIR